MLDFIYYMTLNYNELNLLDNNTLRFSHYIHTVIIE